MKLGLILFLVWAALPWIYAVRGSIGRARKEVQYQANWTPPYFGPRLTNNGGELGGMSAFLHASPSSRLISGTIYVTGPGAITYLYGGELECRQHGIKNCCPPEKITRG